MTELVEKVMKEKGSFINAEKKVLSKEVQGLLFRMLWSIMKNGEMGISNDIFDANADDAEYQFDYLVMAMRELANLRQSEEVDFDNVREALNCCIPRKESIKDKVSDILYFGLQQDLKELTDNDAEYEKELKEMYNPSDELLSELAELIEGK